LLAWIGRSFAQLAAMRVFVTLLATQVVEAEPAVERRRLARLVAFDAGHRAMRARQWKPRLAVIALGKRRGVKSIHRVAVLATIEVRFRRELSAVRVLVAVAALPTLDSILRVGTRRQVAFGAIDFAVSAPQRISGFLMAAQRKQRGFEALFVVTRGTIAAVGAPPKLALVGIRGMAIDTAIVCNRLAEFCAVVAFGARHLAVLADERKIRRGVIEASDLRSGLPVHGRMARFARLPERSLVRIAMALGTGIAVLRHVACVRTRPFRARMAF
jgi:hypothetical protein